MEMEESMDLLLGDTRRLHKAAVDSSADGLDRLSASPAFPLTLLAIAQGFHFAFI
jgi:hypothetical protein